MKTTLVLEDGSCFEGISTEFKGEKTGKLMLNTSVVGYQEIMTDPANAGRIVVLTYPLIGNYGVSKKFNESAKSTISALVYKELSPVTSNWQAQDSLKNFIKKEKILCAGGMDTRTIAVRVRDGGEMYGIISTAGTATRGELLSRLKKKKKNAECDFIKDVSTKKITRLNRNAPGRHIAILDLGITQSIIKQLVTLKCRITLLPYNTTAEKILCLKPDGLVISGGPEGDVSIPTILKETRKLTGKIRMLGISLGHEIICQALGGKIKKMKVGHHGVNYPVRPPSSFKGDITVQNHSFTVDEASIRKNRNVKITGYNVNDNTVEAVTCEKLGIISVQYYPYSPGFNEVNETFIKFLKMLNNRKGLKHA